MPAELYINEKIKSRVEEEVNEAMSLFDCLISRTNNSQLKTTVYKKKTHTDRNWNFYSNQSEHNKTSDYMTQTMQLNDFPKKEILKKQYQARSDINKTLEK